MSDLYSAPKSNLELPAQEHSAPPNKPKAVLVLQVWALAMVAFVAVGFMKNMHNFDGRANAVVMGLSGRDRSYVMIGVIVFLLAMLYGLDKRAMAGRAMGLFVIVVSAAPVYLQFFHSYARGNQVEVAAYYLVLTLWSLLFVYWGYAFSFSERARGYFGQPADD